MDRRAAFSRRETRPYRVTVQGHIRSSTGLDINPDKKVYEMSVGEKQTLEIVKVLYRGAKILIMDEPTAVLTPQENQKAPSRSFEI